MAGINLPGVGVNTDLGSTSHSYSQNSGFGWSSTMGTGKEVSEFNRHMMLEQQQFNAAEAQKNREWQEKMANTAYQRAMTDMKKAGINPILAMTGGGMSAASTPGGSAASSGMASGVTDSYSENYNYGISSAHSYDNFFEMMKDVTEGIGDLLSGMGDSLTQGDDPKNPYNKDAVAEANRLRELDRKRKEKYANNAKIIAERLGPQPSHGNLRPSGWRYDPKTGRPII